MTRKDGERFGRGCVPDARGLVLGGRYDAPPVGRERGGCDDVTLTERTASSLAVAASQIRAVWSAEAVTMRSPIGRERGRPDFMAMTGEDRELHSAGSVPDTCGLVFGSRYDAPPVRRKRGGVHIVTMP